MAHFDKDKFAEYITAHVSKQRFGEGRCAHYVRMALAAAGMRPVTWPEPARLWGGTLLALGFIPVPAPNYVPQKGDIVVIQPVKAGEAGHIEGYNGKNWVSDFVQDDFWPSHMYAKAKPGFVVYRRAD
ncbi:MULTISPECIES: hypothetical protein [unclassified Acidocella]|uniref:hypothetical protein n=1 Tax=unclassified Acidocella TaxID=2648610 RepID=UPI00028CB15B|nr:MULTISPECIES: hypothetical protein [unclassified Acidocella]EKN00808.1 hypothetical protein MXAZACID_03489 [Acidocella sp. MX-AZ02]WBO60337.1 hypothetical protein GT370_05890 [Acidocella sp. MX-AZ03]